MKRLAKPTCVISIMFWTFFACRKNYDPPALQANNHFLAVDAVIYTGNSVSSIITLSRSVNLDEAGKYIPELFAQVNIESSDGSIYSLADTTGNGVYTTLPVNLDSNHQYRLNITTSDGTQYQSDFVVSKQAPPIDSVTWELIGDPDPRIGMQSVNLYVNAHDPNNSTRYYRWDYLQTYKHFATYHTYWYDSAGYIWPFPYYYDTYACYSTVLSQNIELGTTISLSQDVVSHIKIGTISQNDPKMDVGSSFLIRQYPLTLEGYTYWLTIQQNSQSLGGLFDRQPSQIVGNLHCLTDASIPVVGYISASSIQTSRIYISNKDLPGWQSQHLDSTTACQITGQPVDPLNTLVYNYPDTSYGPYFFYGGFLYLAPRSCLDCRYQTGINIKPAYWPHYD